MKLHWRRQIRERQEPLVQSAAHSATAQSSTSLRSRNHQGLMRQHSRLINLMNKTQIYIGLNKTENDTTDHKQVQYDEISNRMESMLINVLCVMSVIRNWLAPVFISYKKNVEVRMLCNTIGLRWYQVSFPRTGVFEILQDLWQAQTAHQSSKKYEFRDYIFELEKSTPSYPTMMRMARSPRIRTRSPLNTST